jgi:hypothetical protein
VGFLVYVEGQRLTADLEDCLPDYEFVFEGSGEQAGGYYYRCDRTRELHAEFGDILHKIHDLEVQHHSCGSTLFKPQMSRPPACAGRSCAPRSCKQSSETFWTSSMTCDVRHHCSVRNQY